MGNSMIAATNLAAANKAVARDSHSSMAESDGVCDGIREGIPSSPPPAMRNDSQASSVKA